MDELEKYPKLQIQKRMTGILSGIMILTLTGMAEPLAVQFFNGGSGTVDDPVQISMIKEVQYVKKNLSVHFILATDIIASDVLKLDENEDFKSTGNSSNYFNGSLTGQVEDISGLSTNRSGMDEVEYMVKYGSPDAQASGQTVSLPRPLKPTFEMQMRYGKRLGFHGGLGHR